MVYIMMAAYNGDKYIREQIDSILGQTYQDWKLFINDDGSSDHTVSIIQEYVNAYTDKIFLVDFGEKAHSAKGNFKLLFEGIGKAEYYAFCDQDDVWLENKLQVLVDRMEQEDKTKPALVFHDLQVVDKEKTLISPSFYEYSGLAFSHKNSIQQLLLYNTVPGCTMLFNDGLRQLVRSIPKECIMHDWWLLLVAACSQADIIECQEALGLYRQHDKNDVGAVEKKSRIQMFLLCFDFHRLRYYINNNRRMKAERTLQTSVLHSMYREVFPKNTLQIIEDYQRILEQKSRGIRLVEAYRKGFVFSNLIYTIKFYLL